MKVLEVSPVMKTDSTRKGSLGTLSEGAEEDCKRVSSGRDPLGETIEGKFSCRGGEGWWVRSLEGMGRDEKGRMGEWRGSWLVKEHVMDTHDRRVVLLTIRGMTFLNRQNKWLHNRHRFYHEPFSKVSCTTYLFTLIEQVDVLNRPLSLQSELQEGFSSESKRLVGLCREDVFD